MKFSPKILRGDGHRVLVIGSGWSATSSKLAGCNYLFQAETQLALLPVKVNISFVKIDILAEDWKPVFDLLYDLTNMVFVILKIQIGVGPTKSVIRKAILIDREAQLNEICLDLTAFIKLPKDATLRDDYSSIIYSLLDNRNTSDTRFGILVV